MQADGGSQWRRPEEDCDLVMKGGITSGVLYPTAIKEIARRYRLRSVGGASAGAIAAVAAAACEYRRNHGELDAFDRLDAVTEDVTKPGFVLRLFQPTERAEPAVRVALGLATAQDRWLRRVTQAGWAVLRGRAGFKLAVLALVGFVAAVVAVSVWALADGGWSRGDSGALVLIALAAVVALGGGVAVAAGISLTRFAFALNRALLENWLGLCSGRTEPGYPERSALTDWLYDTVQRCAGLGRDEPLTFGMLRGDDPDEPQVNLRLVTTDLSASRPVTLPLPALEESEEPPYLFDAGELGQLFPSEVVAHMKRCAPGGPQQLPEAPDRTLYVVPALDLPVIVAARLSLSFPMLLSTVPLWRNDAGVEGLVRHTMSDGGISSNFPIHFFDSLFPGRPTFGLDLQPWRVPSLPAVEMSDRPRPPHFTKVGGIGGFWTQLVNAARNWRDNMQAELPGYRDRVCQIRLSATEGGLNLDMDPRVIKELLQRGVQAGRLVADPNGFDWDRHRMTRYRTFMQMLQRGLGGKAVGKACVYRGEDCGRRRPFRDLLEECARGEASTVGSHEWCRDAMEATDAVVNVAGKWGPGHAIDFDKDAPRPTPTIRIVPGA